MFSIWKRQFCHSCFRWHLLLLQHAIDCGCGTGIFLVISSSNTLVIRDDRVCSWGSVYLDAFGEEDRDLKWVQMFSLKNLHNVWKSQFPVSENTFNQIPYVGRSEASPFPRFFSITFLMLKIFIPYFVICFFIFYQHISRLLCIGLFKVSCCGYIFFLEGFITEKYQVVCCNQNQGHAYYV